MNLKNNKPKGFSQDVEKEEFGKFKAKKKPAKLKEDSKIDLKSKKFWQERFDDEGEDLERFIKK
ncbi:MAG: hypothetical protein WAT79_07385 [Saprospiraceae bacterium]